MNWLKTVFKAAGAVVDSVVPVGVGNRTKFAVIACPLLGIAAPAIAVIPGAQPFLPIIPILQHAFCAAAPALALAGLARDKK